MLKRILYILLFIAILICGCGLLRFTPTSLPVDLPIELITGSEEQPTVSPEDGEAETAGAEDGAAGEGQAEGEGAAQAPTPTPGPTPTPTPTPGPTPTPVYFLSAFSTGPEVIVEDETGATLQINADGERVPTERLPRHGLLIAFVFPLLCFGVPWLIMEFFVVRYIQPRGEDLSTILIKAKDGLFVRAVVSMTARRSLTMASARMTWPRVRNFVEKSIEQELIHDAIQFQTLEELEQNLKTITEKMMELPVVEELSRDFGVEVLRFNIEIQYTPETMDALQRKAEASAGGIAYLAYAAAAHLDPDQAESRELYRIFQETSSQVDAARNLGGGITELISALGRRQREQERREDEQSDDD